jgi:hypothetical protein
MRCPTCKKDFHPQPDRLKNYWADSDPDSANVVGYAIQQCPSCSETIVIRQLGRGGQLSDTIYINEVHKEVVIYPPEQKLVVPAEVPDDFREDFLEASAALEYSTKASAALSRRLLQRVLREKLSIRKRDLSQEIDEFIQNAGAPSYLTGAVDAVRHIGNFASHPLKNTNTGEIVDVEPGEAEWLVEVLASLYDFVFVQPAKLQQRRDSLDKRLAELGKPPLKGA